jgi:hypothetical protein
MAGSFDFEINIHGARIIAVQDPLCPGCLSEGEMNAQVRRLKQELDIVAERAKRAIHSQAQKPLRLDDGNDA